MKLDLDLLKKSNLRGLFKKVQILGAREVATEAYLISTSRERRRGQRRRWAFFNSPFRRECENL